MLDSACVGGIHRARMKRETLYVCESEREGGGGGGGK